MYSSDVEELTSKKSSGDSKKMILEKRYHLRLPRLSPMTPEKLASSFKSDSHSAMWEANSREKRDPGEARHRISTE
ncbi:uncharacterized protein FAM241A isoform X3 [Chamaea fasciata]|uniref:uncharacterized protein FAM241A isoform X3 n=1 Tax=Chamaea fasciata TaxID=190680 RepID=UPI00336A4913